MFHKEATYRFASQAHLDAFKADPAKYEPAYGGYCAYGVSVGAKFDGDPRLWKIVDDKLYLNLDIVLANLRVTLSAHRVVPPPKFAELLANK